jgi:23S rRNA (adenine1618-N6)-methyltransferase
MCNPPFYNSLDEMEQGREMKADLPRGQCTGNLGEMVAEGGEVGFVSRMIDESVQWKNSVYWYTAWLGKKEDLMMLMDKLKGLSDVQQVQHTTLYQGKTTRWAVAWSFKEKNSNT